MNTLPSIERLRELMKAKEAQEPEPPAPLDSSEPIKKENAQPERLTEKSWLERRPKAFEGLSWREIVLLEADEGLDPESLEWLSMKQVPSPYRGLRLPNLKALQRAGQRLSEK